MKFELNETHVRNLLVFLQRTELKGSEVSAYLELLQLFSNPIKEEAELE